MIAVSKDQRVMRNVFIVTEAGSFVGGYFLVGVVASVIMIIPHIDQGNMPVKIRLLRRGKNKIVASLVQSRVVRADVQIMKVSHVQVEQGPVLADMLIIIAGGAGPPAGGKRESKRGGAFWGKRVEFPSRFAIEPSVHLHGIIIFCIWLEVAESEFDQVMAVWFCGRPRRGKGGVGGGAFTFGPPRRPVLLRRVWPPSGG